MSEEAHPPTFSDYVTASRVLGFIGVNIGIEIETNDGLSDSDKRELLESRMEVIMSRTTVMLEAQKLIELEIESE